MLILMRFHHTPGLVINRLKSNMYVYLCFRDITIKIVVEYTIFQEPLAFLHVQFVNVSNAVDFSTFPSSIYGTTPSPLPSKDKAFQS